MFDHSVRPRSSGPLVNKSLYWSKSANSCPCSCWVSLFPDLLTVSHRLCRCSSETSGFHSGIAATVAIWSLANGSMSAMAIPFGIVTCSSLGLSNWIGTWVDSGSTMAQATITVLRPRMFPSTIHVPWVAAIGILPMTSTSLQGVSAECYLVQH